MNECKYCRIKYNPNEFHNTRLCYEFCYFMVCSSIDDIKKILMKEYNNYENLMLPHEHKEFERLKDLLIGLYDSEEELRLNPEPIIEDLNIKIIYES